MWTAGSGVEVDGGGHGHGGRLPEEMEQHLLRIAQEAVTNALKHAEARSGSGSSCIMEAHELQSANRRRRARVRPAGCILVARRPFRADRDAGARGAAGR